MTRSFTTNAQSVPIGNTATVGKEQAHLKAIQTIDASTKNTNRIRVQRMSEKLETTLAV